MMSNHVDTSWPFGVLEYQHVNRVQYFEYFCPGTQSLLAQSISFSTDFTIHKLSSLLYSSQVYFFKYGLKSFFSLATNWKVLTYNKRKWHSNMNPQSVKCLTHSQQLPHVSCGAGALIKGCFAPVLVVKGRLRKALGPIYSLQLCYMCMPMRPNKAETAVHGCDF